MRERERENLASLSQEDGQWAFVVIVVVVVLVAWLAHRSLRMSCFRVVVCLHTEYSSHKQLCVCVCVFACKQKCVAANAT